MGCWRRLLKSPMDSKEIKPVNPRENQPWIFIGRTDAEAPILWPPDAKSRLIAKDPDAGKDLRQEEKGTTEDKMVEWHHQLNGHEFEQTLGDGEGQGRLVCYSPWGRKGSDTTERLNNKYLHKAYLLKVSTQYLAQLRYFEWNLQILSDWARRQPRRGKREGKPNSVRGYQVSTHLGLAHPFSFFSQQSSSPHTF